MPVSFCTGQPMVVNNLRWSLVNRSIWFAPGNLKKNPPVLTGGLSNFSSGLEVPQVMFHNEDIVLDTL